MLKTADKVAGIGVFPNSATDNLTISLAVLANNATLHLFNTAGKRLRTKTVTGSQATVSMNSLPAGMYRVQIITGGESTTEWILKH